VSTELFENDAMRENPYGESAVGYRESHRILVNSLFNVMSFLAHVAIVFLVSPILVHGLGDDNYGVWMLVNSVVAYMALADLGIGAAVLRYVARFEAIHDRDAINRVFSTSMAIFACAGAVVLLTTVGLVIFWQHPFGIRDGSADDMRFMLGVLGASFALALPLGNYNTILRALEKYPTVNTIRTASILLRNVAFVGVMYSGGGLRAIGVTILVCSLLDNMCYVWAAHHFMPSLRFSLGLIDRKTIRMIWAYSVFVFLSAIVGRVGSQGSILVVGAFLPTAAVTYFGIANTLSSQAGDGLRRAIAVLTPAVSKWDARGERSNVVRLMVNGTCSLLFLAMPVQVGLLVLGRPFIALWMGPAYADACYPALAILALSFTPALAMGMAARILEGVGRVGSLFVCDLLQSLLIVTLSIVLVRPLGIVGVAWAAAVPLTVQSVIVILVACRVSQTRFLAYLVRSWARPLIAAGLLTVVWSLANTWLSPASNWGTLFSVGFGGLLLYLPVVLCFDANLRRLAGQLLARARMLLRLRGPAGSIVPIEGDS
jgi:O-antigen/teichoic acid export membrane protein